MLMTQVWYDTVARKRNKAKKHGAAGADLDEAVYTIDGGDDTDNASVSSDMHSDAPLTDANLCKPRKAKSKHQTAAKSKKRAADTEDAKPPKRARQEVERPQGDVLSPSLAESHLSTSRVASTSAAGPSSTKPIKIPANDNADAPGRSSTAPAEAKGKTPAKSYHVRSTPLLRYSFVLILYGNRYLTCRRSIVHHMCLCTYARQQPLVLAPEEASHPASCPHRHLILHIISRQSIVLCISPHICRSSCTRRHGFLGARLL